MSRLRRRTPADRSLLDGKSAVMDTAAAQPPQPAPLEGSAARRSAALQAPVLVRRLGLALKAARERRGLTQERFAELAGLDRTYPSLIERGLREPKLSTFIRLCRAARLSPVHVLKTLLAEKLGPGVVDRTEPDR
jgi:DNA-binding XRE family transcriptional regulator